MDKLKFKEYVWPQNPEVFRCSFLREPVYEKDYTGQVVFTGMGPQKLTITGNGSFFGASAYTDFQNLKGLFADKAPGELVHPVMGTFQVYLTELEASQEPRTDYVAYSFAFREADSDGVIPK